MRSPTELRPLAGGLVRRTSKLGLRVEPAGYRAGGELVGRPFAFGLQGSSLLVVALVVG